MTTIPAPPDIQTGGRAAKPDTIGLEQSLVVAASRGGHAFALVVMLSAAGAVVVSGCATEPRTSFTRAEQSIASPVDEPDVRYWADAGVSAIRKIARPAQIQRGLPFVYLALSGGGGGGAYGAGVLNGWTASGTRPEFTIVSGVSTGALLAPFAFLGPAYDERLRQMYTDGEAERLIQGPDPVAALFGAGAFNRDKLRNLVERFLDDEVIKQIADEDRKGRRLLVVTTNLDAQRAVVWDMGAIAASGGPKAFVLFRDVLAASASIPVVFAPQLVEVEASHRSFQEMHADGTLTAPLYTVPEAVLFGGKPFPRAAHPALYIIVNDRVDPIFEVVPNQSADIATRSLSSLNRASTKAVLVLTHDVAVREGVSFHFSSIERDHADDGGTGFETDSMRKLYDYGFSKSSAGSFWATDLSTLRSGKDETPALAR